MILDEIMAQELQDEEDEAERKRKEQSKQAVK